MMGTEERAQYESVRAAKARLFYPPRPKQPEPDPGYKFRRTHPYEAWAIAMRLDAVPKHLRFEDVLRTVCRYFGVRKVDVLSDRRQRDYCRARQIAAYVARKLTKLSYPEIGRRLGNRDHTTILHADRKIAALIRDCPETAYDVQKIMQKLGSPYG